MSATPATRRVLSFDPVAYERCFLVADLLEDRGEQFLEYGLLGVAAEADPLHVLATPLLTAQLVTAGSVYQSGHGVFRLRSELNTMSRRAGTSLVPVCFIHRHPASCLPSRIDRDFAAQVFINHVAAAVTFKETRNIQEAPHPACYVTMQPGGRPPDQHRRGAAVQVEYALCFSMIVNKDRDTWIEAVRKEWCPWCGTPKTEYEPASVRIHPQRALSAGELTTLREQLEREMEAKVTICSPPGETERVS